MNFLMQAIGDALSQGLSFKAGVYSNTEHVMHNKSAKISKTKILLFD